MISTPTTAVTAEGQALQIGARLQLAEQAYNLANPDLTPLNNVTIATDSEANTVTVTMVIPVSITETLGALTSTAVAYLP